MEAKIIQMTAEKLGRGTLLLIALREDGSIWAKIISAQKVAAMADSGWHRIEEDGPAKTAADKKASKR